MSDTPGEAQQEYKNKRERDMEKLDQARRRDIQETTRKMARALVHNLGDTFTAIWNAGYEHGKKHPEGP